MRSARIGIEPPGFDLGARILDRRELMNIQTLVAPSSVEGLDIGVFDGFARSNEIQLHAPGKRPVLERPRHELRSVIDGDRSGRHAVAEDPIQRRADGVSGHARRGLKQRTLPTPRIDDGEHAKRTAIGQGIVHEIHAPPLGRAGGLWRRPAVQCDVLPSAHAHPQLQAVQAIESSHTFAIHAPTFST